MLGHPCGHRDGMRAAECQEPRRPDTLRADLHVELHPRTPCAAAGGATADVRTREHPRARSGLKVAKGQLVLVHVPPTRRRRDPASVTAATAVSISRSLVKRPNPNRRLLS